MIESIIKCLEETEYDFRAFVSPADTLSHMFPEWINYYQLKYALAKIIKPESILETGVRYGYSAITFLKASPGASYVGIDIDSEEFGGEKGAIEWAKSITEGYETEFIVADTTMMKTFPGDFYDLIHIDAQQDGDGTFSDLEKALEKGRYILVDGYFWSKPNMLSSTYFMEKYKDFIEYALVIPGYAGELLIKARPNARHMFINHANAYETLVDSYDSSYYLSDCGGYETFKKTKGTKISDHRLLAPIYLARPDKTKKILDIGSGRGELAYAFAQSSLKVTGIDYSKDAITIARQTFKDTDNLSFVHADFLKFDTKEKFDVILATDVVEHIEQPKLLEMFDKVKSLLSKTGIFIVHTSPNKLNYTYGYSETYNTAKRLGVYIPKNPRTYYEDIMHINEQTPAGLHRGLKRSFSNVFVWTASAPDIRGSFGLKPNKILLKTHDSIFAICSINQMSGVELRSILSQEALTQDDLDVDIIVLDCPDSTYSANQFSILVKIVNNSSVDFKSFDPHPVNCSYHWKALDDSFDTIFDGLRTPLTMPLFKHSTIETSLNIVAPSIPGNYILELTMVQEGCFWFEQCIEKLPVNREITIV